MNSHVVSLSLSTEHNFSKQPLPSILLVEGVGVEGDAHSGTTVQHLSRVRADPTQPNLRQVHLIHAELFDELEQEGFPVRPADLGENITTRGLDLLGLPEGTLLRIGVDAVIQVTGLRNPCHQIDRFQKGLLKAVLPRDSQGNVVRKAGIMGIVLTGGRIEVGDGIQVTMPAEPHRPLERV
ncbi:MOSC domain-containing protein [Vibrio cholerae]|nr:MOSC domain-containing protein [Vibrio cholerae]